MELRRRIIKSLGRQAVLNFLSLLRYTIQHYVYSPLYFVASNRNDSFVYV